MRGRGQNFDAFMKEQRLYKESCKIASKKVIAAILKKEMDAQHITKTSMAKKMRTTRTAVNNVLNPDFNTSIGTLETFAIALGKRLCIKLA